MLQNARAQNVQLAGFFGFMQLQLIQFVQLKKRNPIAGRLQEKLKAIESGAHFDVLEVRISTKAELRSINI